VGAVFTNILIMLVFTSIVGPLNVLIYLVVSNLAGSTQIP